MNAVQNASFDSTTAAAWATFTEDLHARLRMLPRGDYITITAAQATPGERGLRPYVDVAATGRTETRDATTAHGALTSIAAQPTCLYPGAADSSGRDDRLGELGWSVRGKPLLDGSTIDLVRSDPREDSALVADSVTRCFRHVWNVPHPSFLSVWGVSADSAASGPIDLQRGVEPLPKSVPAELQSLQALCHVVGRRVDARTVRSVCADTDIGVLGARAAELHRSAVERAHRLVDSKQNEAAAVWVALSRTWLLVATSIESAARTGRTLTP